MAASTMRPLLRKADMAPGFRKTVGFSNVQTILATGPKRKLLAPSRLPILWGAPWGDNMMTGTVGLLEALRLRKQLAPIHYL